MVAQFEKRRDFVVERPEHSPHYQYHLHDPDDPRSHRRSVYRFLVRSKPQPFMAVMDCADPQALAGFWSAATGWPVTAAGPVAALRHLSAPATAFELLAVPDRKERKNRLHVDVAPHPGDDLDGEVARLEQAGARRIDVGQGDVTWVVLADPEANEFCVLTPR